jgi:hypothetical protein
MIYDNVWAAAPAPAVDDPKGKGKGWGKGASAARIAELGVRFEHVATMDLINDTVVEYQQVQVFGSSLPSGHGPPGGSSLPSGHGPPEEEEGSQPERE